MNPENFMLKHQEEVLLLMSFKIIATATYTSRTLGLGTLIPFKIPSSIYRQFWQRQHLLKKLYGQFGFQNGLYVS